MHVKEVHLQGFRGFSMLRVMPPQGHVILMGKANTERSDVIEALARDYSLFGG